MIFVAEASQLFDDKPVLYGGDDRLYDGGFDESCLPPLADFDIPEIIGGPHLAGHGHDDDIRSFPVVGVGTDDDGGAFLDVTLIGKGERNENDLSETTGCHRRHRRGCSRPF